jgi:hypothetical protein
MRRRGGVSPCGQIQNEFNAIRANFNAVNADNIIDIYGNAKSLYRRAQAAYCNEAVLNEMTNFIDTELHQKMEELLG